MPKIIETNKETILKITKELLDNEEFENLNCRYIASKCNIAVGTLYHFFKSKLEILAILLLEDYNEIMANIKLDCSIKEGLANIYNGLYSYTAKYDKLWNYIRNTTSDYAPYLNKHPLIVKQINGMLLSLTIFNNLSVKQDYLEFISESIINYSTKLTDYSKIEEILIKIIGGDNNEQ